MAYTIENIDNCTKKIIFDFQSLDLTNEIKSALLEKQKTVNIKGFRKGKAPIAVIEKLYRPQIENEALMGFISNRYSEMVEKENFRPVGYPAFSNTKYDKGKSISFEAIIEIFPEFEIKGLDELSFKKEEPFVEEKEVEDVKNRYLDSKSEIVEINSDDVIVENGLIAVINFSGTTESGEVLPQLKGEDVLVNVGEGRFLPDFEAGLMGMKKDEKKLITVAFPEDYHDEKIKGSKVNFEVELLEIKEKKTPDFTNELAKEFGFESVDNFQQKIKENLLKQKSVKAKEDLFQRILEKLVDETTFDVPKSLILKQQEFLKSDLQSTLKRQGFTDEMVEEYFIKWKEELSKKAEFQVRSGLILDRAAKNFNIEFNDDDLDKKFEELSASTGVNKEEIRKYYDSNSENTKNLFYRIREEKTFDKILEFVKFTE